MKKETENPVEDPTKETTENLTEEPIEESIENPIEETLEKPTKNHIKIVKGVVIFICTLLVIYFGMTIYYVNHFYFGTKINNIDLSGKSVEDATEVMAFNLGEYTLNLKARGDKIEQIKASDIGLKYNSDKGFIKDFKDGQNPFSWVLECFNKNNSEMKIGFLYDDKLLKKQIDKLSYFESSNIIEPKNPSFKYIDNSYVIVDGESGNKVDKDILYSRVADSIINGKTELDLEASSCYVNPKYNSRSQKTIEVRDILNKYVSSNITYNVGGKKENVDGSIINKWLKVNENFEVVVNEEKVKDYINMLSKNYSTVGKTRNFVTSSGKNIKISGGDYGWSIDKTKETQSLISAIKEGTIVTKEPSYSQTAFSKGINDIRNTYVEIDLAKQHMWFYKNGSLIVQGDIVTGNVKKNHTTPPGIYRLKYKAKNVVLRGPGYASPVTYWMPFNRGIGIHDASWRSVFGGDIYKRNGSHGCINSPYNVARTIYNNIEPNTPVVCY